MSEGGGVYAVLQANRPKPPKGGTPNLRGKWTHWAKVVPRRFLWVKRFPPAISMDQNPNAEIRIRQPDLWSLRFVPVAKTGPAQVSYCTVRISGFGLLLDFDMRASDFFSQPAYPFKYPKTDFICVVSEFGQY